MFLAQHLKMKFLRINCNIYSCLAFAFSSYIDRFDDINSIICQKALTYIETLSETALKSMITCLELQFDTVMADRIFILRTMTKLFIAARHFKNHIVFTWEFFMQRFNTLSLETQLIREDNGGEALSPVDICGVNTNSMHFQRKIYLARFALLRTHYVKEISSTMIANKLKFYEDDKNKNEKNSKSDETKEQSTPKTNEKLSKDGYN